MMNQKFLFFLVKTEQKTDTRYTDEQKDDAA